MVDTTKKTASKYLGATAVALLAFFSTSALACPTYHTLTNGTTADASSVMDNFNYIFQCPDFTGNVGVGTTSPQSPLHVYGTTSGATEGTPMILQNANNTSGSATSLGFSNHTSAGLITGKISNIIAGTNNYQLAFYTYGSSLTEKMRIDQTGNVGIGTTSPQSPLHVYGTTSGATEGTPLILQNANNTAGAATSLGFSNHTSAGLLTGKISNIISGTDNYQLAFYTYGSSLTEKMRIDQNGNVGIGTTSPSYPLYVNGTAYATGAAGMLSDIRHKRNIATLKEGVLDTVMKLRPVTFEWKEPKDDGMKGNQIGFIAQEVENVLPSIVLTQNDAMKTKGLKYNELIPVLTKALQEEQDEIRSLTAMAHRYAAETQELQRSNAKLQTRLARLETSSARPSRKQTLAGAQ